MTKLSVRDRLVGESVALATRVPSVRRAIVGDDRNVTPIDFRVAATPADELNWQEFSGDPEAPGDRMKWKVGIVVVRNQVYQEALTQDENEGAELGVAWNVPLLGKAALVGTVPKHQLHCWITEKTVVGMRVGPTNLRFAPVIVRPDRTLSIPVDKEGVRGFYVPGRGDPDGLHAQYGSTDIVQNYKNGVCISLY